MTHRVELGPIQKAVTEYLQQGNTWSDICRELGWMESPTKPESSRLQRVLGLRSEGHHRTRGEYTNKMLNQRTAIMIIRAIGRAPNEFDL